MLKPMCQLLLSALCLLAACYCLLWMCASIDLAFIACDGRYSLFHQNFRCRQPPLALILSVASGIACLSLLYLAWKNLKKEAAGKP